MKPVYTTIEDYILWQPEPLRKGLEAIREAIKRAVPQATEVISYQMPGFRHNGMIAYFAAAQKHYGLYFPPEVIVAFKDRLTQYKTAKAAIRIPLDEEIPAELISEMAAYSAFLKQEKKRLRAIPPA